MTRRISKISKSSNHLRIVTKGIHPLSLSNFCAFPLKKNTQAQLLVVWMVSTCSPRTSEHEITGGCCGVKTIWTLPWQKMQLLFRFNTRPTMGQMCQWQKALCFRTAPPLNDTGLWWRVTANTRRCPRTDVRIQTLSQVKLLFSLLF